MREGQIARVVGREKNRQWRRNYRDGERQKRMKQRVSFFDRFSAGVGYFLPLCHRQKNVSVCERVCVCARACVCVGMRNQNLLCDLTDSCGSNTKTVFSKTLCIYFFVCVRERDRETERERERGEREHLVT